MARYLLPITLKMFVDVGFEIGLEVKDCVKCVYVIHAVCIITYKIDQVFGSGRIVLQYNKM